MAFTPEMKARKAREAKIPKTERQPSAVNPKHKAFADALLEGASQSDAARAAGYHPSQVQRVMRNEDVKQCIAEARAEVEELSTIRKLDVINLFIEAIDMARIQADPGNMINGADKVAKMLGYYAPETKRVELSMDQAVLSNKLRALSDAELMELAAGKAKVVEGEVIE